MERSLIRQYERDMQEVLPKLDADTRDAILALALLPLADSRFRPGQGRPMQAKAEKRREELLAVIRAGRRENTSKAAQ